MTCSKNRSSSERNELLIRFRQTVEFARVKSMPEWCIERDRGVYGYLNNNIQGNGRWYSCKTVMISSCALVGILNTAQNGYFILAAHPNIRFKNSSIHTNEGKTIKKSRSTCTPIEWSTCFSFYLYSFRSGYCSQQNVFLGWLWSSSCRKSLQFLFFGAKILEILGPKHLESVEPSSRASEARGFYTKICEGFSGR